MWWTNPGGRSSGPSPPSRPNGGPSGTAWPPACPCGSSAYRPRCGWGPAGGGGPPRGPGGPAPALAATPPPPMSADAITLKGLPRVKVSATWIPWTAARLSAASGYGAGIASPGWYSHLFTAPDQIVARWFVKVGRLLREED